MLQQHFSLLFRAVQLTASLVFTFVILYLRPMEDFVKVLGSICRPMEEAIFSHQPL
jgi:hypothetical protein